VAYCWLTCVPIHLSHMCTFLFKQLTHVAVHEGHMYYFLFKTQTKPSLFSLIPSPFSLFLRLLTVSLFSLFLRPLSHDTVSLFSLFLRPLSHDSSFRRRSLSPDSLFLCPRIINPNCFDLACLRYSIKLKLRMSIN
jgi:hypothetical protein